jgi:hypothetical protein
MNIQKSVFGVLCLLGLSLNVHANRSLYTALDKKAVRDGYEITIEGDTERSWLIVSKKGRVIFNSRAALLAHTGYFPAISGTFLEWRYDNHNVLKAIIIRVNAQDKEDIAKIASDLFVFQHINGTFCYRGTHKTNAGAHHIADSEGQCQ